MVKQEALNQPTKEDIIFTQVANQLRGLAKRIKEDPIIKNKNYIFEQDSQALLTPNLYTQIGESRFNKLCDLKTKILAELPY
jgi:hypothetical protein